LQIDNIPGKRARNEIQKIMSDWDPAGHGYIKGTNKLTLLYTRMFGDKKVMLDWARLFPYELYEESSHGNKKKLKTSHKPEKSK